MSLTESRRSLRGFAAFVFFSSIGADAWRNSISWYGYGVVVVVIVGLSVAVAIRHRDRVRLALVPRPLLVFLGLAAASVVWSFYPLATVAGTLLQIVTSLAAVTIALALPWEDVVTALSRALRLIMLLSIVFELVVSVVVRSPVFPVWVTAEDRVDAPQLLYWSRDLLLEGGKIQGIVGSSSLLAMVALLGAIVVGVQWAAGRMMPLPAALWLALAALEIALTGSATIYLGLVAAAVVLGMLLLLRRARGTRARMLTAVGLVAAAVALAVGAVVARGPLLAALGKNETLTGRQGIWDAVIGLAQQRPVLGWGWISFWAPWLEPFANLVKRAGVQQLHAHEAWLDVWLQLGVVGLVVFGSLVATAAWRAARIAIDAGAGSGVGPDGRPVHSVHSVDFADSVGPGESRMTLLAPLLLTALLVQSLAESRLLIEGGWVLLIVIATGVSSARRSVGTPHPTPSPARAADPATPR